MGALSKLIDGAIPFFVGHRTQIIGVVNLLLVILQQAGVPVPAALLQDVQGISVPLGALTLVAKMERIAATGSAVPGKPPALQVVSKS